MFCSKVNTRTELRLIGQQDAKNLHGLIDSNREYLRRWHPWVDHIRSVDDTGKMIAAWEQQNARNRGFCSAILFDGHLCGVIHHLNVDVANRWTALSYWLNELHQGQGIMTTCCRAMIVHAFNELKLNRITIECATGNTRSRKIPERLGFKLEGVVRGVEWLHNGYADHAIYGLLRLECLFASDE